MIGAQIEGSPPGGHRRGTQLHIILLGRTALLGDGAGGKARN